MTTPRFIPFGLEEDDVEEFFALTEELSEATLTLVRDWIIEHHRGHYRTHIESSLLVKYASVARKKIPIATGEMVGTTDLRKFFPGTENHLGFVQFLLYSVVSGTAAKELDHILLSGHAAWTISEPEGGRRRIVRRLPEGVAESVRDVASKSDLAGRHLTKAWNNAYGLEADPSVAYSSAIKAVETLACPMILPASPTATLGTAIRTLDDQHNTSTKSTWTFTIENPKDAAESVNSVISMMKLLWHGQVDRHGSDASVFKDATIDQARAAVLLAATLVGWLNDGYLVKS